MSDIFYTGSNYEFTTVPGSSDYDIQFCIEVPKTKLNHKKTSSATAEWCGDPAWRIIKGGPDGMLDSNGFLSTSKVGKIILAVFYLHIKMVLQQIIRLLGLRTQNNFLAAFSIWKF